MIIYLEMINAPEERHKFEVLYRAYRRMMFYIANRILNNEQDAEDAVHSAFVYIAENIQKIDEPMCPKTRGYIVTIVEGRAIDMYRRKQRHPKYHLFDVGFRLELFFFQCGDLLFLFGALDNTALILEQGLYSRKQVIHSRTALTLDNTGSI